MEPGIGRRTLIYFLIVFVNILGLHPIFAASGLFPKMPMAPNVFSVHCRGDNVDAQMTALALAGLINQSSAEVYVDLNTLNHDQLVLGNRPSSELPLQQGANHGANRGLRALFTK